nr:hypothetical protein [Tanacetum cinerariifolium]
VQQMIRDQAKEYYEGKIAMQKNEELWQTERSLLVRNITDALKIIDQLKAEQMRLEEKDRRTPKPVQSTARPESTLRNIQRKVRRFRAWKKQKQGPINDTTTAKYRELQNVDDVPQCLDHGPQPSPTYRLNFNKDNYAIATPLKCNSLINIQEKIALN